MTFDELNDALSAAETALRSLGFTAPAMVGIGKHEHVLGFGKRGDGWVLYVSKNEQGADWTPITRTNLELRIMAAYALTELLSELRAAQKRQTIEVQGAIEVARRFVLEQVR